MRIPAIAALLTALTIVMGCTSVTNTYYYGDEKPTVVHDTVYVGQGSTPPGGATVPEPDTVSAQLPGNPEAPLTGRVSWIEELDPGTATVETVIDYDLGITTHRMIGNLLSNSGLRFELNVMVSRNVSTGVAQYWLIPEFIGSRNWDADTPDISVQASGRPSTGTSIAEPTTPGSRSGGTTRSPKEVSGRPGAQIVESGEASPSVADLEAVILPSLLLRLDGEPVVFDDMDDFDCEPHATMLFGVTVRIPIAAATIEALATGSYGSAEIRDIGGSTSGTMTEDTFTNFRTFFRNYV